MQYNNPEEDKFFELRGVKPPERTPHLTDDEIEERLERNRQNRHCDYRQRGSDIFCITCPVTHGNRVGPNIRLVGTSPSGLPILDNIVLSGYSVRPAQLGKSDAQLKRVDKNATKRKRRRPKSRRKSGR